MAITDYGTSTSTSPHPRDVARCGEPSRPPLAHGGGRLRGLRRGRRPDGGGDDAPPDDRRLRADRPRRPRRRGLDRQHLPGGLRGRHAPGRPAQSDLPRVAVNVYLGGDGPVRRRLDHRAGGRQPVSACSTPAASSPLSAAGPWSRWPSPSPPTTTGRPPGPGPSACWPRWRPIGWVWGPLYGAILVRFADLAVAVPPQRRAGPHRHGPRPGVILDGRSTPADRSPAGRRWRAARPVGRWHRLAGTGAVDRGPGGAVAGPPRAGLRVQSVSAGSTS